MSVAVNRESCPRRHISSSALLRSQKTVFVCNIQPVMLGGISVFKIFIKTFFSMTFIVMNTQYKVSLIDLC